ncbi:MAG: hypothetical protein A2259_01015 [Candidatus Moranbacteria bacterium RIFOXYA2_FULL_43_15]|nr:MAG: hypothetical protein A2259_01015 [Candidatus Moranbacteria bacterium RIFOXYA2_FULL_43_15]
MLASLGEGFLGITGKFKNTIGHLQPTVNSAVRIVQKFVQFGFFLISLGFFACKFFLTYFAGRAHIDKRVQFLNAGLIVFLLVSVNGVSIIGLSSVFILKPFHRPVVKLLRRTDSRQSTFNLSFQFFHFDAFLAARPLSFRAMIVSVVMNVPVFIFLNLIFRRHHSAAFAATDHAGISKSVRFRFWLTASTKKRLDAIIFVASDHWFVFAFVPVARSLRPFKPAVIKWIIEHAIKSTSRQFFQSPFFDSNFVNPWRRIGAA